MGWTRASSLDRVMRCPGPAVIPHPPEEVSSAAAEGAAWGTMAHRWKATGEVRGEPGFPSHARLFEKKLSANRLTGSAGDRFREAWWPRDGTHEVAVAIDCEGEGVGWAELGGRDAGWKGSWPESWATGTLDYVGEVLGDPWVDDLKTGRWDPVPPEDSRQAQLYALARLRLWHPADPVPERVVLSITHWPRYPVVGLPRRIWHSMPTRELLDFELRLRLRWRFVKTLKVIGADSEMAFEALRTGEHCNFCPVATVCPRVNDNS